MGEMTIDGAIVTLLFLGEGVVICTQKTQVYKTVCTLK